MVRSSNCSRVVLRQAQDERNMRTPRKTYLPPATAGTMLISSPADVEVNSKIGPFHEKPK